ncbi:hypothetical protein OMP38_28200 [Cohnella ginsengisoli]|uniref:Uncharacterized protein n=1 Tax=Cohnella ginsengisoli TaxID=425004 RepID=A0A9X4QQ70_9BACL|nr:hypothetical protein [Cohnella ginsengisoli]MDG0794287.1 hypothetical protein [Cohnella ginsengisoli]
MFEQKGAGYRIRLGGADIAVEGEVMTLALGGKSYAVCLRPVLDGFKLPISGWTEEGSALLGELRDCGYRVKLTAGASWLEYTIDGSSSLHGEIRYFAGTELVDSVVRGFLPDHYNRVFQSGESAEFVFSATAKESQFDRGLERIWMTCPAPKTLAFRDKWAEAGPWWGMIVPDPLPVRETVATFRQGRFDIAFTHFYGAAYEGRFPRVQFHFGLETEDSVLDRYVAYYRDSGYMREGGEWFDWWSRPIFCTWGAAGVSGAKLRLRAQSADGGHANGLGRKPGGQDGRPSVYADRRFALVRSLWGIRRASAAVRRHRFLPKADRIGQGARP